MKKGRGSVYHPKMVSTLVPYWGVKEVIRRFRRVRPADEEHVLRDCGFPLVYLGSGAFRHTYQLGAMPLVVKFPLTAEDAKTAKDQSTSLQRSIAHANSEVRSLRRVLRSKRKFRKLHRYMPTVYYFSRSTGVMLMHKYDHPPYSKQFEEECTPIAQLVKQALGRTKESAFEYADVHTGNCGKDENGRLVLFDLGCFEDESTNAEGNKQA